MYRKDDFDKDISQMWLIYTNSYEYYHCLKQLKETKESDFTKRFKFFITYTSWYILIVELCKIFHASKTQHFNIYRLLDRLFNEYEHLDFKTLISLEDLNNHKAQFYSPKVVEIRDRLVGLRNKYYAHFDRQDAANEISIKLTEVELLLKIVFNFIYDIKIKVFSSQIEFREDIFVDIEGVMQSIEDFKQRYHDDLIRKFNEERNVF